MKKIIAYTLMGAFAVAAPAWAERTAAEIDKDIEENLAKIQETEQTLAKYRGELAKDRAEKDRAKARGDYGTQAKESVEIGADKAVIKTQEVRKDMHEKSLEKNKEAARETDRKADADLAPSSGSKKDNNY